LGEAIGDGGDGESNDPRSELSEETDSLLLLSSSADTASFLASARRRVPTKSFADISSHPASSSSLYTDIDTGVKDYKFNN
jgi:hypothetical protein